jgi:hypothetical protein
MKPYKCPICEGTTNVPKGFYADEPKRTKCRACVQGVVYGAESVPVTVPMPYPVPQPYPVPEPYPVPVYTRPYRPYRPWRSDPWYPWDERPYRIWCGVNTTTNSTGLSVGDSSGSLFFGPIESKTIDASFTISSLPSHAAVGN